jgi:hypothetical protein
MNKVNEAGYNESTKFGPSENNPPKLNFEKEYIFDNKEVDVSLLGSELSDIDSLKYFFEKYLFSVECGKPNQNGATILKLWIDIIQQKYLKNENGK